MIPWHRLFGLTLTDYFLDSNYDVELERDLSIRQQFLDVAVVRKAEGKEPNPGNLPDGLENLVAYNLITYKSHQEALDVWAIEELYCHYVNDRKVRSPSSGKRLPPRDFGLYAVSTRFPEGLEEYKMTPVPGRHGIYDLWWGARNIRTIVLSQIRECKRNAPWLMFSAKQKKVTYGAENYEWKSNISSIMNRLFEKYNLEGVTMSYTMEDYLRETREEIIGSLTGTDIDRILKNLGPEDIFGMFAPEDRLRGLGPEDRLRGLGPEDRLRGLGPEDRLRGLGPEEVFGMFAPEDRLKGLTTEEIEEYLRKIKRKEQ